MQNITITVWEAGTAAARTFAYKIQIEGNIVAERTLTPVQTSAGSRDDISVLLSFAGHGQGGSQKLSAHPP